jgi:hypothetical protein
LSVGREAARRKHLRRGVHGTEQWNFVKSREAGQDTDFLANIDGTPYEDIVTRRWSDISDGIGERKAILAPRDWALEELSELSQAIYSGCFQKLGIRGDSFYSTFYDIVQEIGDVAFSLDVQRCGPSAPKAFDTRSLRMMVITGNPLFGLTNTEERTIARFDGDATYEEVDRASFSSEYVVCTGCSSIPDVIKTIGVTYLCDQQPVFDDGVIIITADNTGIVGGNNTETEKDSYLGAEGVETDKEAGEESYSGVENVSIPGSSSQVPSGPSIQNPSTLDQGEDQTKKECFQEENVATSACDVDIVNTETVPRNSWESALKIFDHSTEAHILSEGLCVFCNNWTGFSWITLDSEVCVFWTKNFDGIQEQIDIDWKIYDQACPGKSVRLAVSELSDADVRRYLEDFISTTRNIRVIHIWIQGTNKDGSGPAQMITDNADLISNEGVHRGSPTPRINGGAVDLA